MTMRFLTAASVLALLTACSGRPEPASLSPTEQGYNAYRVGNYGAAEAAYNSALAADRSNQTALLGLAEVYESTGRGAQAAALYREVRAVRTGTIRVWNDGRQMQDGVYEVALRRLGLMGEDAAPMTTPPTSYAPVPTTSPYPAPTTSPYSLPEPTYALDQNGIVSYGDPTPIETTTYAPAQLSYTPAPIQYRPAPSPYQTAPTPRPRPVQQYQSPSPSISYQPAPTQYQSAPISYTPAPIQYQPAPQRYEPAPIQSAPAPQQYEPAPQQYAPAPVQYQSVPQQYQPAPIQYQPAPVTSYPTPVTRQVAPVYAPRPVVNRRPVTPVPAIAPTATAAPVGQPGYTVVDGNFVYISAEDIAAGATPPTPTPAGPAADGYGVPVPISSSPIPLGTPGTYSAPRGVDVQNGITIPNLN